MPQIHNSGPAVITLSQDEEGILTSCKLQNLHADYISKEYARITDITADNVLVYTKPYEVNNFDAEKIKPGDYLLKNLNHPNSIKEGMDPSKKNGIEPLHISVPAAKALNDIEKDLTVALALTTSPFIILSEHKAGDGNIANSKQKKITLDEALELVACNQHILKSPAIVPENELVETTLKKHVGTNNKKPKGHQGRGLGSDD